MRVVVKITGTVLVTILLTYPLWAPHWGSGILGEVAAQGMPGGLIAVAVFFGIVALYCRALHRTLAAIRPEARTAAPASVWWMFAIPYNFVEDFFIVRAVATSLAADARPTSRFVRWWARLGYGWCAFQILSLFPGAAGYAGGAVAILLWAAHWIMTARILRTLSARQPAVRPVPGHR
ncbi:hypothetical protein [Nonomuraea sp. NPDC003754]